MLAVGCTIGRADGVQRIYEPIRVVLHEGNPELDLSVWVCSAGLHESGGCLLKELVHFQITSMRLGQSKREEGSKHQEL